MTNKVEKGQKYRGSCGTVYEILSEPFTDGRIEKVAYRGSCGAEICWVETFESMTLIREPKFKVGDRVAHYGRTHDVVSVTDKPDNDGDFWYVIDDGDAFFECALETYLKAAE